MNEIEAIGELAQGSLTARALEPAAGEASDGHTHEGSCLNCGTPLVGSHCHACGQRGHQHKTLGAFFHDLLHGVLHFEGKIWRTLPMLAWKPGQLTREYIDGRRATYVSPIALFLFTIFLMFAVFSAMGADKALLQSVDVDTQAMTDQAYRASGEKLEAARERLAAEDDADDRAELEADIAQLERQRAFLGDALGTAQAEPATEADGLEETGVEIDGSEVSVRGGLKSAWQRAKENPQLLIYKLQTNAYKFSWLLIPISVPFVALTFLWRRKFGLYDHTIFTTYSITFMLALAFVATLVSYFVSGWLGFLMLLYAPVHMYRQLRGTYSLGWFSALWRLIALSTFAWWAIAIFAGVLIYLAE
jgi:hypothetical protein